MNLPASKPPTSVSGLQLKTKTTPDLQPADVLIPDTQMGTLPIFDTLTGTVPQQIVIGGEIHVGLDDKSIGF